MNSIADQSITIHQPAQQVFSYVSNMENFKTWFPAVISIESHNDAAHGSVGKLYLETVKVPLKGMKQIQIEVMESKAPHYFVTEGNFAPLMPRMEVHIKPIDDASSTLTWKMFSRNDGFLFKQLMLPLAKSIMTKRAAIGVQRLKKQMES